VELRDAGGGVKIVGMEGSPGSSFMSEGRGQTRGWDTTEVRSAIFWPKLDLNRREIARKELQGLWDSRATNGGTGVGGCLGKGKETQGGCKKREGRAYEKKRGSAEGGNPHKNF